VLAQPARSAAMVAYADHITDFCVSASQIKHRNSISSTAGVNIVGVIVLIFIWCIAPRAKWCPGRAKARSQ
jgi:hypothetical protein